MSVQTVKSEPEEPRYCDFCGSENSLYRGMVHRRDCFSNQAWDIEDSCTCHNPYRCRGRFHQMNLRKKAKL